MSIREIIREVERKAQTHEIGRLQQLRKQIKGRSRLAGQSIFHEDTIKDTYAFHYGGRKELQFNIGIEPGDRIRHGLAFSLEPSQSLPDPDLLVPSIKRFNDFLRSRPDYYPDMNMWYFDEQGRRSAEYRPVPIVPDLIRRGVFICFGKMQLLENIDYDLIVKDFDRLLKLYRFVEGEEERPSAADTIAPTFYTATSKPTKPASFFRAVQDEARTPITLGDLTLRLQAMNRTEGGSWLVPRSSEDHDLVIEIRTRYATTHGYLEPAGLHDILPELASTPEVTFRFRSGWTAKADFAAASFAQRELDIELRHNVIQQRLCEYLLKVLSQDVGAEILTGDCRIDVVTRIGEKFWFYEIKTAGTARACIREALPQLLEYSYWPGAQEAERLVIVGEAALDPESARYLIELRRRFGLPIEYGMFDMKSGQLLLDLRRPAVT